MYSIVSLLFKKQLLFLFLFIELDLNCTKFSTLASHPIYIVSLLVKNSSCFFVFLFVFIELNYLNEPNLAHLQQSQARMRKITHKKKQH